MMAKVIKTTSEEIEEAVRKALDQKFIDVGIIAHDNEALLEIRRDFDFLRTVRKSSEGARSKVGLAILLAASGGLMTWIVSGFRLWTRQP
jgi:hypothetical protein